MFLEGTLCLTLLPDTVFPGSRLRSRALFPFSTFLEGLVACPGPAGQFAALDTTCILVFELLNCNRFNHPYKAWNPALLSFMHVFMDHTKVYQVLCWGNGRKDAPVHQCLPSQPTCVTCFPGWIISLDYMPPEDTLNLFVVGNFFSLIYFLLDYQLRLYA